MGSKIPSPTKKTSRNVKKLVSIDWNSTLFSGDTVVENYNIKLESHWKRRRVQSSPSFSPSLIKQKKNLPSSVNCDVFAMKNPFRVSNVTIAKNISHDINRFMPVLLLLMYLLLFWLYCKHRHILFEMHLILYILFFII